MPKVTLDLNINQAKIMIKQMPLQEKIELLKELMRETWAKRIDIIFKNIDQRRKKYKISAREITREIEKARQEFYARHS